MADIYSETSYLIYEALIIISLLLSVNSFVLNAPFLYPLKTSENLQVFWCFQGLEKACIGNEWVNNTIIDAQIFVLYVAFRTETIHLFYFAKHMTGSYMKHNIISWRNSNVSLSKPLLGFQ